MENVSGLGTLSIKSSSRFYYALVPTKMVLKRVSLKALSCTTKIEYRIMF